MAFKLVLAFFCINCLFASGLLSPCLSQYITSPDNTTVSESAPPPSALLIDYDSPTIISDTNHLNPKPICSPAVDYAEGPTLCTISNPYVTRRFTNQCHFVLIHASSWETVLQTFEELELIKFNYNSPVYYIYAQEESVLENLVSISNSKDVVMPPPKTIILTPSGGWSFFCYFCQGHASLQFQATSQAPSPISVNSLYRGFHLPQISSGYGSIGTFQSLSDTTEGMYNACKRGRLDRGTDSCHVSYYFWFFISSKLNFSMAEGDFFGSEENPGNPLAFCETCSLTTPDAVIYSYICWKVGMYYCKEDLGSVPLSWELLVHPFKPEVWIGILFSAFAVGILHRNGWIGFNVIVYMLAQPLQGPLRRLIQLSFISLLILSWGYSSIFTSVLIAPLPEKEVETFKELLEGPDPHKLFAQKEILYLFKMRWKEARELMGMDLTEWHFNHDEAPISNMGMNGYQNLLNMAKKRGAYADVWNEPLVNRYAHGGINCRFVKQHSPPVSLYMAVRSYLKEPFMAHFHRMEELGLISYWSTMFDHSRLLWRIMGTRKAGKRVTDVVRDKQEPRAMKMDENVAPIFQLFFLLCGGAVVVLLGEMMIKVDWATVLRLGLGKLRLRWRSFRLWFHELIGL